MKQTKFIFLTGGVVSSLGKGIASASLGLLLKSRGLNVTIQKLDPYINVDPGTMSPIQHGEVFVTDCESLFVNITFIFSPFSSILNCSSFSTNSNFVCFIFLYFSRKLPL